MTKFNLFYKKNDNGKLFSYFQNDEFHKIKDMQNYIPIYNKFFSLNNTNYNSINLNQRYSIYKIKRNIDNTNKFYITIQDTKNNKQNVESFFKFSPLIDPTKYMAGKYKDISKNVIENLPKYLENTENANNANNTNNANNMSKYKLFQNKIHLVDNSAYVDSFFSYLTSKVLYEHKFTHGLDFYGSFLGIKEKYKVDITDELEYLYDYDFFHKSKEVLFSTDKINEKLLEDDTRKNRSALKIEADNVDLNIKSIDNNMYEDVFQESNLTIENVTNHNNTLTLSDLNISKNDIDYIREKGSNASSKTKTNSECSSRISDTSSEGDDEENDEENDEGTHDENSDFSDTDTGSEGEQSGSEESEESDSESDSDAEETLVYAEIFDFPCQIICLEKLDKTLDSCIENLDQYLSPAEWKSCLFQIIMILISYQKMFEFTHNDLHTNNIMYINTEKKYLNYKFNGKYYKVPTYGKIYKLIDFGRSIYKFNGQQFCSDSFYPKQDAAGQFNFHTFYNKNKKKVLPNMGFDLCRLSCSLYDFFIEEIEELKEMKNMSMVEKAKIGLQNGKKGIYEIAQLIYDWCLDDNGKNILYKSNGEERYPDFKLYKMITRKCTKHIPHVELERNMFQRYCSSRAKIGKKAKVINIDELPNYTEKLE